jgi:hypothetical protein
MDAETLDLLRVMHTVEHRCSWCGASLGAEVWSWDAATYDKEIAERRAEGRPERIVTHGLCAACARAEARRGRS